MKSGGPRTGQEPGKGKISQGDWEEAGGATATGSQGASGGARAAKGIQPASRTFDNLSCLSLGCSK